MMEDVDPNQLHLESKWVWYAHFPCISTNYSSSYIEVGSFSTIADFWRLYNNLPCVDHIHRGEVRMQNVPVIAYSLFRENVRPEWEDDVNLHGSEWGCRGILSSDNIEHMWTNLVLAAIGERLSNCVGLRVINKSNKQRVLHKVEVWMDTCDL